MEIFKLFESTIADIQPGHINTKDLRRDQLLDNYAKAANTLETLIKAKENEITYRRNLIEMLEKSKVTYDNKLVQAKQIYHTAKKHAPDNLDLKNTTTCKKGDSLSKSSFSSLSNALTSTTPPLPSPVPPNSSSTNSSSSVAPSRMLPAPASTTLSGPPPPLPMLSSGAPFVDHNQGNLVGNFATNSQQSSVSLRHSDLDIPMPSVSSENVNENRSSLDRRLSEFLKTFPNLTQAGMAQPGNAAINNSNTDNNLVKPLPGYYTQQLPPAPIFTTPPIMAMMRFPPPNLVAPPQPGPSISKHRTTDKNNKYSSSSSSSSSHSSSSRSRRR